MTQLLLQRISGPDIYFYPKDLVQNVPPLSAHTLSLPQRCKSTSAFPREAEDVEDQVDISTLNVRLTSLTNSGE
jgi:hypothetical protein